MKNFFKSNTIYKIVILIFVLIVFVKINKQLITLNTYNGEIATLKEKITVLEEENDSLNTTTTNSREDNENMARKDLKMYYPNETPYKGY